MAEPRAIGARGAEMPEAVSALVRGLREGSPEACAELCRRFGPRLHRFAAARLAGDGETAEELVIQTFADAARNIRRFNPRKSTLSAWLYGILRRQVHGELRRRRRQKSVPASAQVPLETVANTAASDDTSTALAAQLDARRSVAEIAGVLSDVEFEVLVLNCVDELSAREIGQIVGRSERAIHSLLHRARQKARERLTDNED
jgi:RNA polymerase sigma-70 factor (ECF subfamily)